jgi:RsmE family RNA methyltransferase
MKRLWPVLASLGVEQILITNAARVERAYFDTQWVRPEHYQPALIQGLEQSGDTRLPQVTVCRRLKPLVEDQLDPLFPGARRFYSHPTEHPTQSTAGPRAPVLLAVGPEGGWIPFEIELLETHGFEPLSLGPRRLRTDTACVALLARLGA